MEIENKAEREAEEKMHRLLAKLYITHSRYHSLFPKRSDSRHILDCSVASVSHKRKKINEKLVAMEFLKDSKNIILGYDKTSERGDINFADASEPKISDFYYNKLTGGLGGIACFDDGRYVIVADKKGVFAWVDLSKGPNIDDIKANSMQTNFEGVLDISLSPFQTKLACGNSENKCLILDLGKEKMKQIPALSKKLSGHSYSVNCVNWHPFKSLVLSSSLDTNDMVKVWDPYTEQLVKEINLHHKVSVTKSYFHPNGNTFFSIGKDNTGYQYELRFGGYLNKFKLDHEPTALDLMANGNVVIGDSGGALNWYDRFGTLIKKIEGSSGVVMMSSDASKTILAVARQREHTFEFYTHSDALDLELF